MILDEVDMIASARSSRKGMCISFSRQLFSYRRNINWHIDHPVRNCKIGVEAKLFATLLHLVDSINMQPSGNKIFIIGTSGFVNQEHLLSGIQRSKG